MSTFAGLSIDDDASNKASPGKKMRTGLFRGHREGNGSLTSMPPGANPSSCLNPFLLPRIKQKTVLSRGLNLILPVFCRYLIFS